jgi:hypothetical protein
MYATHHLTRGPYVLPRTQDGGAIYSDKSGTIKVIASRFETNVASVSKNDLVEVFKTPSTHTYTYISRAEEVANRAFHALYMCSRLAAPYMLNPGTCTSPTRFSNSTRR